MSVGRKSLLMRLLLGYSSPLVLVKNFGRGRVVAWMTSAGSHADPNNLSREWNRWCAGITGAVIYAPLIYELQNYLTSQSGDSGQLVGSPLSLTIDGKPDIGMPALSNPQAAAHAAKAIKEAFRKDPLLTSWGMAPDDGLPRDWSPETVKRNIGLPDLNGRIVAARMRAGGLSTPIRVLSALDAVDDRIAGLEAGADDYLVKPFAIGELVARLRALLRRVAAHLNGLGLLPPRGRVWLHTAVRSILMNPAYKGALVYGRRSDGQKNHESCGPE